VRAQFFDGKTARPRQLDLSIAGGRLLGSDAEGDLLDWPLDGVSASQLPGARLRLQAPNEDQRLTVDAAEWAAFAPFEHSGRTATAGEWKLIVGLTGGALGFAALIFLGVPAAAGPLARITPPAFEARIGENMEKQLTLVLRPCNDQPAASAQLNALGRVLSEDADTPFNIRVRAVRAPMVNAFALPGGTVLVTDRLIAEAKGPDELAGVLAHEIAHVERRHVMHSVWRSMGMGLLLDAMVGGGTGAGQQAVLLAGGVTEQRFSRTLESEADARAIEILRSKDISTAGLADFFDRLADKRASRAAKDVAEWFATHPDSERRSSKVRAAAKAGRPALSAAGWQELKQICRKVED
jgi:Zn-dependent protease with chaperone function